MSEERTLGQLVAEATSDLSDIIRAEIALAKAELKADLGKAGAGGGMFAAAGYLGLLATITGCITIGYALVAAGLSPWLAFLIVTGVLLLLAALLVAIGVTTVKRVGPPRRAIDAARETVATLTSVRPGAPTRPNAADR